MSRILPIPDICVTFTKVYSDDLEREVINTDIEVTQEGITDALTLGDPEDLLLLRQVIEETILSNPHIIKISNEMKQHLNKNNLPAPGRVNEAPEQPANRPGWLTVMEDYLRGYVPAESPGEGIEVRTSDFIAMELSDMANLSIDDVAWAMSALGFRATFRVDGTHGWMMRPASGARHSLPDPEI